MTLDECVNALKVGDVMELKGAIVVPGEVLFKMHDEKGFPTFFAIDYIMKQRMLVDWRGFVKAASKSWKPKKIYAVIIDACKDTGYGKRYFETFK